jgi:DNA-binding beta-propeller fold protein YncE
MRTHPLTIAVTLLLTVVLLGVAAPAVRADLMIIGLDEKVTFDAEGNRAFVAPGKDSIVVVDIANREPPRIVATFPLINSIFGPPTNLAITPDERLAVVANSVNWVQDGTAWKPAPDNKLYVFDLKASPPAQVGTVEVGKQPSGLAMSKVGDLLLVTNRADKSVSVLTIQGTDVKLVDTVAMGDEVASVAIAPDGKRALVTKFPGHKIALLEIAGQKATYGKWDMPVGPWPYNIGVTPNGRIGISVDNGNRARPTGTWTRSASWISRRPRSA